MRIVIDLQGAQSESRFRGIGRYALGLALGLARNAGGHELWLLLNGALDGAIPSLRAAFDGLIPAERIRVFDLVAPVAARDQHNAARGAAAELLREHFLARLRPDAVLVTSLFEGYVDDAVTSVGRLADGAATAIVLHDLIPLLHPRQYLAAPEQRRHYDSKIAALRRAGLLLANSEHSRQEAIGALGLDPARVVTISGAVDARFHPAAPDPAALAGWRARHGVGRAIVLCAPGGFDGRKNVDGLIGAYALLPAAVRAGHQLVVASRIGADDRAALAALARRAGLAPDELVLAGYVDDDALILLYRACALFVLPSRHEGFGLPALEAMSCGAIVIGADRTSLPEVIGCAEALFDPDAAPAMAAKIGAALTDAGLRERLRRHGRDQAARFSWDRSAQRALRALEALADGADAAPAAAPRRRRLAFVSPLPPERTGIADYALEVLPALCAHFEIELVVQQPDVRLPDALAALPRRSLDWLRRHARDYDQILYQFGNSPFHSHMFALLRAHPGVVVLHDFFLSGVLSYEQLAGGAPHAWSQALFHAHGYPALRDLRDGDLDAVKERYPCNLAVLEAASRVIVHSEHAFELARAWYGRGATGHWSLVPHPRTLPAGADRAAARRALGIRADAFVVCSFGFVAPTKLSLDLLRAWVGSRLHADPACELVFVGSNHGGDYGAQLSAAMRAAGAPRRIRLTGWTDDALYQQYLQAADLAVQLRCQSRGESSGAVLHCLGHGLATIVNANGALAELPADAVWRLDDAFDGAALRAALEALRDDAALRARLGQRGRALVAERHSPGACARRYADALDLAWREAPLARPALLAALAALPAAPEAPFARQLAACVARAPDPLAPRQLLVDVTAIARHDLKTGIERVVRTQLLELLRAPLPGWRVEPVCLSADGGAWHYRYARRYACALLGLDGAGAADAPADVAPGDVFHSADSSPATTIAAARSGLYAAWRARGVSVNFMVYDLLPVLRPEFFPRGAELGAADWLDCVSAQADRLICISDAVRRDLRTWLAQRGAAPPRPPRLRALHLGADIDQRRTAPPGGPGRATPLADFRAAPSFLMVATIEPRKGHLQALDAFERLWAGGLEANLVIVGQEGWTPLPAAERRTIPQMVERLRHHPALGRRLFWLDGIDDDALDQVYRSCTCLLAPSEGEGFGLPLIEAARHGLPVLARDLPVFREVAGRHAHYFSGLGAADLAGAIEGWLALHARGEAPASAAMPWMTWQQHVAHLLAMLDGQDEADQAQDGDDGAAQVARRAGDAGDAGKAGLADGAHGAEAALSPA